MPWSSRLPQPLKPRDHAPLKTWSDVRAYMIALPEGEAQRPGWHHAAKLAIEAALSGDASEIRAAADQVERALFMSQRLDLSAEAKAPRKISSSAS